MSGQNAPFKTMVHSVQAIGQMVPLNNISACGYDEDHDKNYYTINIYTAEREGSNQRREDSNPIPRILMLIGNFSAPVTIYVVNLHGI